MSKKLKGKLKSKMRKKNTVKRRTSKRPTANMYGTDRPVGQPDYSMGKENYMKPLSEDEYENAQKMVSERIKDLIPQLQKMTVDEREKLKVRTNNIINLKNTVEKYFRKYPDELTLKEFHEIEGNFIDDFMIGSALEQMEVKVVDLTTGTTGTIESLDTAFNQYIR